MPITVIRVT